MIFIIAGTAGHIDHGKTALVRALTGIETDRLAEEKRRGISIDIGFAHLNLTPDIRIGFVDVPGHERFVKNMLAGVAGIDVLLFVIAADESIKPQTREHFEICRLLGIRQGIVVLTKSDLVDDDILGLVRLEVEEFVAGSFLEDAPVVAVSSTTGAGLDELKAKLTEAARKAIRKDPARHFRLPVDRSFSLKGFGTVATGTLVSGAVTVEQEVELYPTGRRLRVRNLQVHGSTVNRASAGQRTAVNLAAIEPSEIARGMVLADAGRFHQVTRFDSSFELLASAKPLKNRAPVHLHAGTAEVEAEVRLLDGATALAPGAAGYVRFLLRDPVLLLPGDRFIVRMFSPVVTIGGGRVLDIEPPARLKRESVRTRLETLTAATPADVVSLYVREAPWGLDVPALVARTGFTAEEIVKHAAAPNFVYLAAPASWLYDRAAFDKKVDRLKTVVHAYHKASPLAPGMPREELRTRELAGAPPALLDALLNQSKVLVAVGEVVRLATHKVALQQDESQALEKIEAAFRDAGLSVPALPEVLAKSGVEPARSRSLLQILMRDRKLIRIGDDLVFHRSAMDTLRALLATHKGERFTVPTFKDWTGVSRKYAIPLLEYLDREHVTRREGDERLVL
ncbi:MAG: selenocysteine-specific translation elongation factor [Bryobacteraceae bacterium]